MLTQYLARWLLLSVAAATLGAGVTQVAISHHLPAARVEAASVPVPVDVPAVRPPDHVDEVQLHPSAAPRPLTVVRVVTRQAPPTPHVRLPQPVRSRPLGARTFQQELDRAVARIPFYRKGVATWVVWQGLPSYGLTDRVHGIVYVNPQTPRRLLYSVVVHEWAHVISTLGYGTDLRAADAAVLRWYGGSSPTRAIELAADCVARVLGASWTHYTACADGRWRYGARYLMVGWKLPDQNGSAASRS